MSQVLDFRSARPPVEDDCEAGLEVCPASSMKSVDSLNDRHFLSASARVRSASAAARTASRPSRSRIGGSSRRPMFKTAAPPLLRSPGLPPSNRPRAGRNRRPLIGDMLPDGAHVVAVTLNQIGELLWIAGGGDQLVASCEDALSDRPAQPPSASRDQPYLRHGIPLITKRMFSFIVTAQ